MRGDDFLGEPPRLGGESEGLLRPPQRPPARALARSSRGLGRTDRAVLSVKRRARNVEAVRGAAVADAVHPFDARPSRLLSPASRRNTARRYGPPLVALALAALLLALLQPNFYRPENLHVLMQQFAVLGLVTLGQLLVLLVGGIDLSVGAVMNASLIIIAVMNRSDGYLLLSLVACVGLGAAVGLANGLLVSLRDVPPFAATLGMTAVVQGAILAYTKGIPAGDIPSSLRPVALSGIGIVPYSLMICLSIGAVFAFVLRRGTFGRKIYAVGRSPEVARRVAISTTYVRVVAYVMCGVLAALAGIILSAYVGYVDPRIGGDYNLASIAAAVLGGVAFTGGEGGALGALAGALFLLVLLNVVTLSSLSPFTQLIVQGVVILVAVSAFQFIKNRSAV
jgi:ribose/xylose/arabinose/galactoside ABC-type transport system permease subunit